MDVSQLAISGKYSISKQRRLRQRKQYYPVEFVAQVVLQGLRACGTLFMRSMTDSAEHMWVTR